MSSIKNNISYRMIYLAISNGLTILLTPYIARVLGPEQLGIYSYTGSIITYFALFAYLGIHGYGVRSIAQVSNDVKKRSQVFLSMYAMQLMTSTIMLILYGIYLKFFCISDPLTSNIQTIQTIVLVACFVDINWFYFGLEKIKFLSIRDIFVKVLTAVLVFLCVKTSADLWIYVLIMASSFCLTNLILWLNISKHIELVKISFKEVTAHFRTNIVLFVPIAAMTVYHVMDKTILGMLSTYEETGYYYNAESIITIPLTAFFSINQIMRPRMSALIGQDDGDAANKLFEKGLKKIFVIVTGLAFTLVSISYEFTPIYLGENYRACIMLIIMFSPLMVIKIVGNTIRQQYLIPHSMDNFYARTVTMGALANIVVNFALIPFWGAKGAIIGTIVAESIVTGLQLRGVNKLIDINKLLAKLMMFVIIGFITYISVRLSVKVLPTGVSGLVFETIIAVFTYMLLSAFYIYYKKDADLLELVHKFK